MKINLKLYRIIFCVSFSLSLFTFVAPLCMAIYNSLKYRDFIEHFMVAYVHLSVELHIDDNIVLFYKVLIGISFVMSIISATLTLFIDKKKLFCQLSILSMFLSVLYPISRPIIVFLAFVS